MKAHCPLPQVNMTCVCLLPSRVGMEEDILQISRRVLSAIGYGDLALSDTEATTSWRASSPSSAMTFPVLQGPWG